ncbi:MAG: hypothetical protein Phog2KO_46590 [Phototrophicaceae bacterium]
MVDTLNELRDVIELDVRAGYDTREEIIDSAIEFLMGDYDPQWLEEQAIQLTDSALKAHFDEQKEWRFITDCDRLDEAFAELDRHGIVARQDFTCCQTCGHSEINLPIEETMQYRNVEGYVFFHWQDTESAVRSEYLYLAYGSVSGKESESKVIASKVVDALERAGLHADWNGSINSRICIHDIKWQRRRNVFNITI